MNRNILGRQGVFALSLAVGIGLWEIVGRNTGAAFMASFSETLVRLWQLAVDGPLIAQFLNSAALFLAGFAIAFCIGAPLGLLLARVRILRVGLEPYIMVLYATPMVALIPFILSIMGLSLIHI